MNTKKLVVLLTTIGFVSLPALFAAMPMGTVEDHQNWANEYEKKAAEQREVIAQHEELKAECQKQLDAGEKTAPMKNLKEMEKHCEGIIESAKDLEKKYSGFAKWHRDHVAELQSPFYEGEKAGADTTNY